MSETAKKIEIPEEGIVRNLSFEEYLADPGASSSMIRYIADGFTLAHAKAKYIDGKIKKDSNDLDFGRKAHAILLEPRRFRERHIVMPDFGAMQSSINRERKKQWLETLPRDVIVLTEGERDELTAMMNQLLNHATIPNMLADGVSEVSLFWMDPVLKIRCKARLDYLSFGKRALLDYKTTRDARHDFFTRDVANYGYQIQLSHYLAGAKALKLPIDDVLIIAQESSYPYLPISYYVNEPYLEDGEMRRRAALTKIAEAMKANHWPGYEQKVHELMPPTWLAFKEVL